MPCSCTSRRPFSHRRRARPRRFVPANQKTLRNADAPSHSPKRFHQKACAPRGFLTGGGAEISAGSTDVSFIGAVESKRESAFLPVSSDIAQIERERKIAVGNFRRRRELALLMAVPEKPREPARLGFVAVHRKFVVAAAAGMRDVISAAAERALVPSVVKIEPQRRVNADGRLQTDRRLPRAVTHAGDAFAVRAGRMQRHAMAVAGDGEAVADEAARFYLQAFERAIHVTHRAAAAGFFAEDVPRFERGAEFDLQIALLQIADAREAKLKMRREPVVFKRITGLAQIADDIAKIRFAKMRQHPAVVDVRAPAHEIVFVGSFQNFATRPRSSRCCARLMRACGGISNARISTRPSRPAAAFRREQFINRKFGAMRVAAGVNQQIAEQPVARATAACSQSVEVAVQFLERHFEFVKRIVARLVNARRLRGRADEQTAEQPAQRRMILPIREQRAQQIRPAQHRRILRRFAADDDVVAAAGAGVAAVEHEFFRAEPRLPRFLVKHRRALDEFVPGFARVHVDLDDAGIGRDGELVQARIARRRFAFDDDRRAHFGDDGFDAGDQIEIILRRLNRRHEKMQPSIARLDAQCRANDPRRALARRRDDAADFRPAATVRAA